MVCCLSGLKYLLKLLAPPNFFILEQKRSLAKQYNYVKLLNILFTHTKSMV